ncbi:LamG domain-containing protein [bacterium SCSIO 12741]|nr:LamG domain-containing protein [bacterium SCSIO 12741]
MRVLLTITLTALVGLTAFGQGSGNCLRFNGSNEYVRMNHSSSLNITSTWTIEFWINPDATPSGWDALVSKNVSDRPASVWLYYNSVEVWYGSGTNGLIAYTNFGTVSAGEWQHIAATRSSGGSVKIYVNGVLEATFNGTSTPPTNSDRLNLARRGDNAYHYDGFMDEVRYWNVERTQSEIRESMCKTLSGSETGLVSYWKLDEGSGSSTTDSKGSNNGSLRNTPTWSTSGAPIGTTSQQLFTNSWSGQSIYLASADGDSVSISNVTGNPDGIVLYSVNTAPNTTSGSSGVGGNDHYFGVFKANGTSPTYTMTYYYGSNSLINTVEESDLRVYQRTDNSTSSWSVVSATQNTGSNTLTATGLNSEYILGSVGNPLPVELISFYGVNTPYGNDLTWETQSEISSDYFLVERSEDGVNWTPLTEVSASGFSNEKRTYTANDLYPAMVTYYRLTQYDFDGKSETFPIISVHGNIDPENSLRPVSIIQNPVKERIQVRSKESHQYILFNSAGAQVTAGRFSEGMNEINVQSQPAGIYFLMTDPELETSLTHKVVISE